MKVVVCGAGIAGLALGVRLGRDGADVTIVERAGGLRDEGYMIDFFGPGFDAADRMGLLPALEAVRYDIPDVSFVDARGRRVAGIDYARLRRSMGGRLMSLMRGDLERALFEAMPPAVRLAYGASVDAVEAAGDGVSVRLTGGETVAADLLVGADGIHSHVRALAFGPERDYLRYLDLHTAAYIIEDPALAAAVGNEVRIFTVPDRTVGVYPIRGGRVATFFAHRTPDPAMPASPAAALAAVYGDFGGLVGTIVGHAASVPDIYYDQVAQIVMPGWSRGRVALVGDACQAVSLLAGQGASLAVAGAEALADALKGEGSVAAALRRYETGLKPVVEKKQAAGRRTANWFVPASRWHIFVRNVTLRLAATPLLGGILASLLTGGGKGAPRPEG